MSQIMLYDYDYNGLYVGCALSDTCQITGSPLMRVMSTKVQPPDVKEPSVPLWDGEKWLVFTPIKEEPTQEQKAAEQYAAIDAHIAQCIKSNGWDYDNIGEIAAYALLSEAYKVEARAVWAWVEACHAKQSDIKNGVVKYDSVGDALDALPVFDIHD